MAIQGPLRSMPNLLTSIMIISAETAVNIKLQYSTFCRVRWNIRVPMLISKR